MKLHESIEPFREAIEALQRLFTKLDNPGVIIGGVAVSFLGRPRLTEDVDAMLLLSIEDIPRFLEAASVEQINPRIHNAAEFAKRNRVLLLKHSPTETNLDVSLGVLPFEKETVERGIVQFTPTLKVKGRTLVRPFCIE
jgi:hypothetical protein